MPAHAHMNKWLGDHFDQSLPPHCHGDAVHVQLLDGNAADPDALLHVFYAACVNAAHLKKQKIDQDNENQRLNINTHN